MTGPSFTARRNPLTIAALAAFGFCVLQDHACADWLHYRGPTMNGISTEKGWSAEFPATGPKQLWKVDLGIGTASVTVSGDRLYSMGNQNGNDVIQCLDTKTGAKVWKHQYPLDLDPNMFEGGPRSTPTIDGGRVYTVSHQGDLWCLDAATGKKIWYKHYQQGFGGRRPQWGYAGSPTIDGNVVLLDVGGKGSSTVALDKATGAVVWKAGDDEAGYASPVVASIGGKKTIVIFKASHLVGLDAKGGKELWRTEWKTSYDVNAATPVILGDRILISSGYNHGAALIGISGGKAREVWKNKSLREHFNSPVVVGNSIYGVDGNAGGGNLVCLDFDTGAVKWIEKSTKGGSLISADGKLIVLTEKGELVIADAVPTGFHAISRAPLMSGRCWVQPVLSGGRLFLKNNAGTLACYDLRAK
ncbi:MAG: PQQ-binding-like beta-propeller repeat protein [Chthoniobacteraceae bacterium]